MDKSYILREIDRTAKENDGKPLGRMRFSRVTGIKEADWSKYWVRFSDAVVEAGYKPNQMSHAYEEEWLFERIISLIRELGKFPTMSELRFKARSTSGFPSRGTVSTRLGRQHQMARKIITYCGQRPEYKDAIDICEAYLRDRQVAGKLPDKEGEEQEGPSKSIAEFGYVYLMKHGRFYKIGRSGNVERRSYDLGIKLPETVRLLHKINTDDPAGIEEYWHKRFGDKRKRGEWFELSGADVATFRKRTFM